MEREKETKANRKNLLVEMQAKQQAADTLKAADTLNAAKQQAAKLIEDAQAKLNAAKQKADKLIEGAQTKLNAADDKLNAAKQQADSIKAAEQQAAAKLNAAEQQAATLIEGALKAAAKKQPERYDTFLREITGGVKAILAETTEEETLLDDESIATFTSQENGSRSSTLEVAEELSINEQEETTNTSTAVPSGSEESGSEEFVLKQSQLMPKTFFQSSTEEIDGQIGALERLNASKKLNALEKYYLPNARAKAKTLRGIANGIKRIEESSNGLKVITALIKYIEENKEILSIYRGITLFKPVARLWGGGEVTSKKLVDDLEAKLKNLSNKLDVSTRPDSVPR